MKNLKLFFLLFILFCNVVNPTNPPSKELVIENPHKDFKDFKKKTKEKMTKHGINEDIVENLVENLHIHVVDFFADLKNLPQKIATFFIDFWESLKTFFTDLVNHDMTGSRERAKNKYEEERQECVYLGGKYEASDLLIRGHCQFPYTLTGCFGLCAHGIDLNSGFDEVQKQLLIGISKEFHANDVEADADKKKEIINKLFTNLKGEMKDGSKEVIEKLISDYDGINFDEAIGCSCYVHAPPRNLEYKELLTREFVFSENAIQDDELMSALVAALDSQLQYHQKKMPPKQWKDANLNQNYISFIQTMENDNAEEQPKKR